MREALRNFDIEFDQDRARNFLETVNPQEYEDKRDRLISYNSEQMRTNLSERYNVLISNFEYEISDGQLWGKDMEEPFVDTLKRGRDYRREYESEIDHRREDAEVTGFEKMQNILTNDITPEGTTVLSVSPPGNEGSIYEHNFIDLHTKKINEKGEHYIESQRVSSGLSIEEYKEKISAFTEIDIDEEDPAASFLENPIAIENTLSPEDIKYYLYKDHDYMDQNTFEIIINNVSHLISEYSTSLVDRPDDDTYHKELFNSILNKADDLEEDIKIEGDNAWSRITPIHSSYQTSEDVYKYAYREVKEVKAGCGLSGGYDLNGKESPFSVAEHGTNKDKYGEREFKCPSCNKENTRPYNKLLNKCQHCKSSKVSC